MVVDSSALLAILFDEPERRMLNQKIAADTTRLISAATFVEAAIVVAVRLGEDGSRAFDLFVNKAALDILAVDANQAEIVRRAYSMYGRGAHPAALNFGDCFSYAAAKATGEALLFKGGDFALTDIAAC